MPLSLQVVDVSLHFLPVAMRIPLKFGDQTLTRVTCARAAVQVGDSEGKTAVGWGETPLSAGWVWPASIDYSEREEALRAFSLDLAKRFRAFPETGHALEVGHAFLSSELEPARREFNRNRSGPGEVPHLAALLCFSPFDIALHDACGRLAGRPIYETYSAEDLRFDLSHYLDPAPGTQVSFAGRFPADFLQKPVTRIPVWHLAGGLDPLEPGDEGSDRSPCDGHPFFLRDWIRQDGLKCLKIKLRGNDAGWDFDRMRRIGALGREEGVLWLTADFNCAVEDPSYVNGILDRLRDEDPLTFQSLLYVEQPFPYDLDSHRLDVHSVSARKPLFMDESAHDWRFVRTGRELGWNGVALKTCKTQTGALLSLCWAKAHGMALMVQDLTNPMLAQIPHVLLAAHAGTIMGVESNAMQFYPDASLPEAAVHPGLYQRRHGHLDLDTLAGPGFGYRLDEIDRDLPSPALPFAEPRALP